MAVLVQGSRFSLPFVEETVSDNDLLRDRLVNVTEAFVASQEALSKAKAELAQEKQRRKACEARLKELEGHQE